MHDGTSLHARQVPGGTTKLGGELVIALLFWQQIGRPAIQSCGKEEKASARLPSMLHVIASDRCLMVSQCGNSAEDFT